MRRLTAVALLFLAGCTTERGARTPLEPPDTSFVPTIPFTLEHTKDDGDFAHLTVASPMSLRARILREGTPVPGVLVTWKILGPPLPGAGFQSDSTWTDPYGYAVANYRLGTVADGQNLVAEVPRTNLSLSYHVYGEPDQPTGVTARVVGGAGTEAALAATVTDRYGNESVANVPLTWTVESGRPLLNLDYSTDRFATVVTDYQSGSDAYVFFTAAPDSDNVIVTANGFPPVVVSVKLP